MNKTLTVAVPSYNVEKYLADSLASYVAGGVDERLEVIVVDDGSRDATAAIANEFARLYPAVFRMVSKENGGHGSAVNAGIDAARGKYFRVIDADDRICTTCLSALLDELDRAEDDLVLDLKREVRMDTGASRLMQLPADLPVDRTLPFASVCERSDLWESFMIHSSCLRTSLLKQRKVRLLEHTFYVDYEFIVKSYSHVNTVRFLNQEGCNYYIGNDEQSVAPANYVRRWDDHTRVTEEMLRYADTAQLDSVHAAFVDERARRIADTHYNIALVFDSDRKRGRKRAYDFRRYVAEHHPRFSRATDKRYRQALILHYLGFDAKRLNKLMGRG